MNSFITSTRISLMEEMAHFKDKKHSPATKWLRTYSWTPHTLQSPPRPRSDTQSYSVSSWTLNFPCQIKHSIFFLFKDMQSWPARCIHKNWRELREVATTRSIERQSLFSDLPNELITPTCPVLWLKRQQQDIYSKVWAVVKPQSV